MMTTFFLFLVASIVSVCAVFLLRARDEKRLRVFGVAGKAVSPRVRAGLWGVVFLPGVALLLLSHVSAFLSWFGLLTVSGWLIAAQGAGRKPDRHKPSF